MVQMFPTLRGDKGLTMQLSPADNGSVRLASGDDDDEG
jgi:hypothetical protein